MIDYERFEDACSSEGLPLETTASLWSDIHDVGWDEALDKHKTAGAYYKERWEKLTCHPYSFKTSGDWRPEGLTDDDLDYLKKEYERQAKAWKDISERDTWGSASKEMIEEENRKAGTLEAKLEEVQGLQEGLKNLEQEILEFDKELAHLDIPTSLVDLQQCPGCKMDLFVHFGKIRSSKEQKQGTKEDLRAANDEINRLQQEILTRKFSCETVKKEIAKVSQEANIAMVARDRLKNIEEYEADKEKREEEKKTVAEALRKATLELDAKEKKLKADELHEQIQEKWIIVRLLKSLREEAVA